MNRAVFVRAVPRGLRGCSLHIYSVVNQDMSGQRAEGGPRLSAALLLLLGTGVLLLCNQFFLGKIAERQFTVSLTLHVPQVGPGFVAQYRLAESIKPALFVIVVWVRFHHFSPPFCWGIGWYFPFPLLSIRRHPLLPANRLLFENFFKICLVLRTTRKK